MELVGSGERVMGIEKRGEGWKGVSPGLFSCHRRISVMPIDMFDGAIVIATRVPLLDLLMAWGSLLLFPW